MTILPSNPSRNDGAYRYHEGTIRALRDAISEERFGTYLSLAGNDGELALQLYTRNAALGAAFHGPLQALEITLRNAVHDTMTQVYGNCWFDSAPLRDPEQKAVVKATQSLQRENKPQTPGRVIAAVNFGFWVALFAKKYDATLWRTVLHQLFGSSRPRADLHDLLDRLRTLRNRIAHHEPILQRHLRADHDGILWLLNGLSPDTATWVQHHSRVRSTLALSSHRMRRF